MNKPRFTEQQIASALRQAKTGTPIGEIFHKMAISNQRFYNWRGKSSKLI